MIGNSEPGVRRCSKCDWLFISADAERIRRCKRCKQDDRTVCEPRQATLHMEGLTEGLRQDLRANKFF